MATILAWIVGLGPGSPNGPDEVGAYQLILEASEESCRAALQTEMPPESVDLYHGAAAACLAALHGKSARWDEAQAAYDALEGPPDGCLDRQAYDMLEFAVNAYRANPKAEFKIRPQNNTVAMRCPRIRDLTVARDSLGTLDVQVQGERLGRVLEVTYRYVESCPVPLDTEGTNSVQTVEQSRESLRALIEGDPDAVGASFIWVGITAIPDPWVADATCVPILDAAP